MASTAMSSTEADDVEAGTGAGTGPSSAGARSVGASTWEAVKGRIARAWERDSSSPMLARRGGGPETYAALNRTISPSALRYPRPGTDGSS